jgi:hypothetical protein
MLNNPTKDHSRKINYLCLGKPSNRGCRVDYRSSQSAINLKASKGGCFNITPPRSWPSDRDVTFTPLVLYTADILFPRKEKCIILLPWQHKDDVTRLSSHPCCYMWYNRLLHQASNKGLLYVIRKKRQIQVEHTWNDFLLMVKAAHFLLRIYVQNSALFYNTWDAGTMILLAGTNVRMERMIINNNKFKTNGLYVTKWPLYSVSMCIRKYENIHNI